MGQSRAKMIAAGLAMALALGLLYRALWVRTPTPAPASTASRTSRVLPAVDGASAPAAARVRQQPRGGRARRYDTPPPSGIADPKLRLDLLTRLSAIAYQGSERNIFQYRTPPPPPVPKPVASATTAAAAKPTPPAPPPPPPIPLRYYGYAHKPGDPAKRAFFVEGEEIYIAGEGEMVNKRYKIGKIGVNTVEVEDTVTRHRQTLPLQEQ